MRLWRSGARRVLYQSKKEGCDAKPRKTTVAKQNLHQNRLISQGKSNFTDENAIELVFRTSSMVGRASCVGLLALGFMLVNPLMRTSARALEVAEEGGGEASEAGVDGVETRSPMIAEFLLLFTPTSISGEMTPTTEAGLKKQLEVTATVTIQNAEDYTVYIGAKTTGLTERILEQLLRALRWRRIMMICLRTLGGMYYAERSSVPGMRPISRLKQGEEQS